MRNKNNTLMLLILILTLLIHLASKKTRELLQLNLEEIITIIFIQDLMMMKKTLIIYKCSINIKIRGKM
jgi:hypothetical protein